MYLPTRLVAARRGLSLLEVLVALTIFLLSFVAIGRLVSLASDQAVEVQYQSQGTRLAQSKLNEVIAGAVPLQGASGSFDEDPDWQWSVDAQQNSDVTGLWTVTVTVKRAVGESEPITATLTQMVLDPSVRGSVFDTVSITGASDTAPSGGSTTSSAASASQAQQTPAAAPTKPTTPQVKPQTNPQVRPQTNPQVKPQTNPQVKPQTNPQVKPQTKP